MDRDYIRTGRFIHDELRRRASQAVAKIPELWRSDRRIYPTILLWPSTSVRTTDREQFSGVVFCELPEDPALRPQFIAKAVATCDAYGILVTEEVEGAVRSVFETQHGTETWRLPIKDHGGARVLGAAARRTNAESIGVLWQKN